ncbi:MAG TPA: SHOCT domain-containing protein [Symbiobacteriaceae bacterium]
MFDRVPPRRTEREPGDEPMTTLRLRLARGEISVEEYEALRERIQA